MAERYHMRGEERRTFCGLLRKGGEHGTLIADDDNPADCLKCLRRAARARQRAVIENIG